MANVLPQKTQKKVWRLYRARFILTLSLFSLALSALAFVALVPGYLALSLAAPPVAEITPGRGGGAPDAAASINRAQVLLKTLSPILSSTSSPSATMAHALSQRPRGLSVTRAAYDAEKHQITLVGSGGRSAINTYRDTLGKDPLFSSVSVPVSALVGSDSGNFSMTILLAQPL